VNCGSGVQPCLTVVLLTVTIGATACKNIPPPPPVLPIGGDFTLTRDQGDSRVACDARPVQSLAYTPIRWS
jgi:hypothetical protein